MNPSEGVEGTDLQDFIDPGMHVTWLVQDLMAFGTHPGPTSDRDRSLHFGLTHREWVSLYFDVIGVNREGYKKILKRMEDSPQSITIGEFDEDDPGLKDYPMLSRISGINYDAIFERAEVDQLRRECLHLKAQTSNELALRGLDKILLICQWAKKLDLNIYLMAD